MQSDFKFTFTEDHLIASMLRYRQQIWWRRPFLGLKWLLGAIFGALLAAVVWKGYGVLAGFIGGIIGLLFLGWPIDKALMRKRFRKSPFHNDEIAFSITDSGARVVGRSSEVKVAWSAFSKARRFKDGLLLFQGPAVVTWLPDAAAVDTAASLCAQELARTNIADYREV